MKNVRLDNLYVRIKANKPEVIDRSFEGLFLLHHITGFDIELTLVEGEVVF